MSTSTLAKRVADLRAQRDQDAPAKVSQTPRWATSAQPCKRHSNVYCGCK